MKQKYNDFGNRIEGAKKFFKVYDFEQVKDFNTLTLLKYLTKDNLWPKDEIDKGDQFLNFIVFKFRQCVRSRLNTSDRKEIEEYVKEVNKAKKLIKEANTENELIDAIKFILTARDEEFNPIFNHKLLFTRRLKVWQLTRSQMEKELFGVPDEEKPLIKAKKEFKKVLLNNLVTVDYDRNIIIDHNEKRDHYYYITPIHRKIKLIEGTYILIKNNEVIGVNKTEEDYEEFIGTLVENRRQKRLNPRKRISYPYLSFVRHEGTDFRAGQDISTEDIQDEFHFYGGQFGNWLSQKERGEVLNYSFDAFCDLAYALGIRNKDISLEQSLGIAFGARGRGNSLAHYEPDRRVINLTRIKGAGSLAHEYGHALDHYLGIIQGDEVNFSTTFNSKEFQTLNELADYLKDPSKNFYLDSIVLDSVENRKKSYWATVEEKFARAFNCFIIDRLKSLNIIDDYLCYEFDIKVEKNNRIVSAHPQNEEREELYKLFSNLIDELKEKEIFSIYDYDQVQKKATLEQLKFM